MNTKIFVVIITMVLVIGLLLAHLSSSYIVNIKSSPIEGNHSQLIACYITLFLTSIIIIAIPPFTMMVLPDKGDVIK